MHGTADTFASEANALTGWGEYSTCLLHCSGSQQTTVVTKKANGDTLVACTDYSGCKGESKLCIFDGLGHSMSPASRFGVELVPSAWRYLAAATPNPVTTKPATDPSSSIFGGCIGWQLNERTWPGNAAMIIGFPIGIVLCCCCCCFGCFGVYWKWWRKKTDPAGCESDVGLEETHNEVDFTTDSAVKV